LLEFNRPRRSVVSKWTVFDTSRSGVLKTSLTQISIRHQIQYRISMQEMQMARTFAYCRVSTADQTTENQIQEILCAGFAVDAHRVVCETISGSVAAMERPQFAKLSDRLEREDVLIVTKLDRLGRNAMDVRATVEGLAHAGVRVHCLALGGVDLCSPAGRMTMGVISAVAEFERDLLIERTLSGLSRAKAEGKALGRPSLLSSAQQDEIRTKRLEGVSLGSLAKTYGVTRSAIQRAEKRTKSL
jgi:putative DNA-invertase from lambdoid prophage Rac